MALPKASRMEEKATMLIEVMGLLGIYHHRGPAHLIYIVVVYLSIAIFVLRIADRWAIAMFPVSWRRRQFEELCRLDRHC